jgi:hypothetical protein
MPRKFLDTDKRKWLELYESGKTEIWIARERAKCDPRTVKRGIEEARRKQDARVARAELLKDALRKHQDSLLEELDKILAVLTVPSEDFVALSWYHNDESIFTEPEAASNEQQTSDVSESRRASKREGGTVRGLLKQHLKNDRLWKVLAQWEKAYAAHITARIAFQRKTVALLEVKTGCKLVYKDNVPKPFLYSYTAGDSFYKSILQHALGTKKDIDLERDIVIDTAAGNVRYHNSILAEAPGNEARIKANLLNALRELKTSPEVIAVIETYEALKEITTRARQVVEQINLLGLIPGQCEICRRLGM